jgi:hypothetical protein
MPPHATSMIKKFMKLSLIILLEINLIKLDNQTFDKTPHGWELPFWLFENPTR